ncbi:hypothetical protein GTO36_05785 [bacterium]|nr:hypothetical protein [bacterium]
MKRKIIAGLSLMSLWGFALPVFAQVEPPPEPVTSIEDIINLIDTAATWLFTIILAVAVVMLLYAAFRWMTAGGDETAIASSRKLLIYALVGIGIAFLAKGLVSVIRQLVGA